MDTSTQTHRLPNGLAFIKYTRRAIHNLMAETSHNVIAHVAEIRDQEKLRKDPRFPLYQAMQRNKRYQEIFAGTPGKPIFG